MATITESLGTDLKHDGDLVKVTGGGDLETVSGLENVKSAILCRIITRPGEIIHRPTYGVGIGNYQNAPSTIATHRQLALRIEEQLLQDPRIEAVESVSIQEEESQPEKTNIGVRARVKGYGEVEWNFQPFGEVAL